jgi:hypothetical protein
MKTGKVRRMGTSRTNIARVQAARDADIGSAFDDRAAIGKDGE